MNSERLEDLASMSLSIDAEILTLTLTSSSWEIDGRSTRIFVDCPSQMPSSNSRGSIYRNELTVRFTTGKGIPQTRLKTHPNPRLKRLHLKSGLTARLKRLAARSSSHLTRFCPISQSSSLPPWAGRTLICTRLACPERKSSAAAATSLPSQP